MYKVRFHLATGPHFMHWQVRRSDKEVMYFDPAQFSLVLHNCTLKNYRRVAERIFRGENKSVCAYILCEHVEPFAPLSFPTKCGPLSYNPRTAPYWRNLLGDNRDGYHYDKIVTIGKTIQFLDKESEFGSKGT